MNVAGLIFSNIHDRNIPELTHKRTMASVPFGGRYRLIDFTLSNMVNADITKIGIITHYNYQSLMDHIGSGKDWDLSRSNGGIKILPPFITAFDNTTQAMQPYSSRLEALIGAYNFISRCTEDYFVLSDCDTVCNIDLRDVINFHVENHADITIVAKNTYLDSSEASASTIVETDENDRVLNLLHNPTNLSGNLNLCLNIFVLERAYLESIVLDSLARGYKSFTKDIIARNKDTAKFMMYSKFDGYYASISSLDKYYKSSMDLLNRKVKADLFETKSRPIYTKVKNSPPAKYFGDSKVSNSLIADGCIIEGTVENSILFRGVKVGKNTVIRNSIIMQDAFVGDNVTLNCVISDKNAVVKNGRYLSGHETHPFSISKGTVI
ncbi:MAG: glucose-1-phosphate adenylyltransferase subunit GlgD [Eubacteriales bacterium]